MEEREMNLEKLTLAGLSWGIVGALAGCDDSLDLANSRPRVVQAQVAPGAENEATLTLWIADAEGEPVDVAISWSAGSQTGEVLLAAGSAPLVGLPTELGLNSALGQEHAVTWDLDGVPSGAVALILTVDDRPFDTSAGDTYRVEGLDPRVGSGPIAAVKQ